MEKSLAIIAAACEEWLRQQVETGRVEAQKPAANVEKYLAELTKAKVVVP